MKLLITTDEGEVLDSTDVSVMDWKAEMRMHPQGLLSLLNPGDDALRESRCQAHDVELVREEGGPDMPTISGRLYCPVCQAELMKALDGERAETRQRVADTAFVVEGYPPGRLPPTCRKPHRSSAFQDAHTIADCDGAE